MGRRRRDGKLAVAAAIGLKPWPGWTMAMSRKKTAECRTAEEDGSKSQHCNEGKTTVPGLESHALLVGENGPPDQLYTAESDVWMGLDRIRSKMQGTSGVHVVFVAPALQSLQPGVLPSNAGVSQSGGGTPFCPAALITK